MGIEARQKFDGYAAKYDEWFMKNENLFTSELRLFKRVLKSLGIEKFEFYQTLVKNPLYTNEKPEDVIEGYKSGGYVAIIAEK